EKVEAPDGQDSERVKMEPARFDRRGGRADSRRGDVARGRELAEIGEAALEREIAVEPVARVQLEASVGLVLLYAARRRPGDIDRAVVDLDLRLPDRYPAVPARL